MDRLTQLRGEAGGSRDSTLDTSAAPSEAYLTANESSKYFSLSEDDSSFDIAPIKDVSLASTAEPDKTITGNDQLISNLSPITKKNDLLGGYKFDKQIEAANILSGGVDIFDDNDNSYDGDELVIDDNAEIEEKSTAEVKNAELPFQKPEEIVESLESAPAVGNKELDVDGKKVNAIDIGNGLYLYRKPGEEELAAVQIVADDNDQPSCKYLKVRENAEGNLEVYEEIEIEVPTKEDKSEKTSQAPFKETKKVVSDPVSSKVEQGNKTQLEITPIASTSNTDASSKVLLAEASSDINLNAKMTKINETRKSPVIHSTPNKEGKPLTKTMVDMHLHPSKPVDKVRATDNTKQKTNEIQTKHKDSLCKEVEKLLEVSQTDSKEKHGLTNDVTASVKEQTKILDKTEIQTDKFSDDKQISDNADVKLVPTENKKDEINKEKSAEISLEFEKNAEKKDDGPKMPDELNNADKKDDDHKIKGEPNKAEKKDEHKMPGGHNISEKKDDDHKMPGELNKAEKKDDTPEMPGELRTQEKEKEDLNKIVQKNDSADMEKKVIGQTSKDDSKEIKNNNTNLTEVKNTVSEAGIQSLISNDNSQTDVNSQQEEQVSESNKNVTKDPQIDPNSCNETKSSTVTENDVRTLTEISSKPQDISDKLNKNESKNLFEPTLPKSVNEKLVTENWSGKINNNIDEIAAALHKNNETAKNVELITENKTVHENTKNVSLITKEPATISTVPKKEETFAQNKVLHSEVLSKEASVTQTKQTEVTSSIGAKILKPNDILQIQEKQLDQHKSIPILAKDTPIADTKQFSAFKSATNTQEVGACNKSVLDKPIKEDFKQQDQTNLDPIPNKDNIQTVQNRSEFKTNRLPPTVPMGPQRKLELTKLPISTLEKKPDISSTAERKAILITDKKPIIISNTSEKKPIVNNNAAVPFGQWTSANRQEFLNKIKEAKIPATNSNTKPISKPNDLNRRDVLQKIDSQRQSSNAATKHQDLMKLNVKNEAPTFKNKPTAIQPSMIVPNTKALVKEELPTSKNKPIMLKKDAKPETAQTTHRPQVNSTVTSKYMDKSQVSNKNEMNNQDLIDKTVEGIINRAFATKPQDSKPNIPKEPTRTQSTYPVSYKSKESKPSILDAIEMKMNELHGIPFVERPPHELPKVYNRDIKTYAKNDTKPTNRASKIPNLLPVTQIQKKDVKNDIIDLDSEEEVIEHEPITGDIDLDKKKFTSKQSNTSAETTMAQIGSDSSKKESIITEKDFDKFVRRNSITYENCLTVNLETNKNRNVVQGFVQKDTTDKNIKKVIPEINRSPPKQKAFYPNNPSHRINITSKLVPVNEDAFNKNYQSKLQLAYQTALTTKQQMESPITILEDKPVKVVFMDTNTNFQASQLNVQGPSLSPSKKSVIPKEPDSITISTGDSLDSDVMDTIDSKAQEDTKTNKTKHQRKQVLTPVEAPELELIVPGDLGIEASPKKKRRMDDFKPDLSPKSLVPKKSYLLGRGADSPPSLESSKDPPQNYIEERNIMVTHKDTATAIDNLVKAAELIENQAGNFKPDTPTPENASPATPVKRGRGRPRKYPLPDGSPNTPKAPSPQKKPRLVNNKEKERASQSASDEDTSDESYGDGLVRENWTMGKINENIVCPICNKLFRSENVVFKHVKHCPGPSPVRSDSDKRSSRRLSNDSKSMDSKIDDTDGDTDSVISKKSASVVAKKNTPKKRKSKEYSSESKEDVIVIEDTPIKSKVEKSNEPKLHESRKPTKTKAQYKATTLSCEICGKTFRQLSYLVSHKLLHKKANSKISENVTQSTDKSVFSCEVCSKEFRKLHHLVQHRIIHNPSVPKLPRKSSSDQNVDNKNSKDKEPKPDDQSAAFRCEPCDKSFRKLHHLVEHRETHDGINRQKAPPTTQTTEKVIQNPPPPPQCEVCKKTFRKLHHLIEHKEQHVETSSEKSDDKSVKSALSTKDIIHECSLCYMVFPNEHSLNKHSVFCQKKKRQSGKPQKQSDDEAVTTEQNEGVVEEVTTEIESVVSEPKAIVDKTKVEEKTIVINANEDEKKAEVSEIKDKPSSTLENKSTELPVESSNRDLERSSSPPVKVIEATQVTILKEKLTVKEDKAVVEPKKTIVEPKKAIVEPKTPNEKTKKSPARGGSAAKRRKSNLPLARIKEAAAVESSDDDEVCYMLNPDYKESSPKPDISEATSQGKLFMKVRAKKRNSLQFERPNSKDLGKRRASLQHPPKIPRLKPKVPETNDPQLATPKPAKVEPVPCTDSDDSDVKYSFPVKVEKPSETEQTSKKRKSVSEKTPKPVASEKTLKPAVSEKTPKPLVTEKTLKPAVSEKTPKPLVTEKTPKPVEVEKLPKEKRKSLADKRKSLSGIARRKSMGKPVAVRHKEKSPVKEIKRRRGEVEHRCDCGQLFSSAALLARHTSLAHTPPRVRRRRVESPAPAPEPPVTVTVPTRKQSTGKPTESRKSSARSEPDPVPPPKAKPGRPPCKKNTPTRKSFKPEQTVLQSSRKSGAHRGVPVPEKMKKIIDKLK